MYLTMQELGSAEPFETEDEALAQLLLLASRLGIKEEQIVITHE